MQFARAKCYKISILGIARAGYFNCNKRLQQSTDKSANLARPNTIGRFNEEGDDRTIRHFGVQTKSGTE